MIGLYKKDSNCIKNNKTLEFDIYRLEFEELNDKKEIAEITGDVLSNAVNANEITIDDEWMQDSKWDEIYQYYKLAENV